MKEREGNHWGRLMVTSVYDEREKIPRSGGYDTVLTCYMDMLCECGNTLTMKMADFDAPGKRRRYVRDCGCGIASGLRKNASGWLHVATHDFLTQEARRQGISFSRLLSDVMDDYKRRVEEALAGTDPGG